MDLKHWDNTLYLMFIFTLLPLLACSQGLRVSDTNRHLVTDEGNPFVWVGDTAWELFHSLDREEADRYLQNRANKNYSVIQAVVLAENDGLRTPNPYGDVPFHDLDPTQPNEDYFNHVDYIVDKAEELGLVVGMLPTWGDKIFSEHPGAGPIVFDEENARIYGRFLGQRYRDKPIVWILGGDRNVANRDVLNIWRSMAEGIEAGAGGRDEALITYHPRGGSVSSAWFHDEPWLDFNMYQSGHGSRFNEVYNYAEDLMILQPPKPFVDGEPAYEDIARRFWEYMDFSKPGLQRVPEGVLGEDHLIAKPGYFADGYFTGYDVRVHAYWDFLSGAAGYTYGNNALWQMCEPAGPVAIPCLTGWREAMDRTGSKDMQHVRALFESRPFDKLIPDQSLVYGQNAGGKNHIRAAGSTDGSYAFLYLATGQPVQVVMSNINGSAAEAWWYNPRNGSADRIEKISSDGIQSFTPPTSGEENDWVLVIDSQQANYPAPGRWNR